jgi:steroid delta-isomerase-like uncharacterized protein
MHATETTRARSLRGHHDQPRRNTVNEAKTLAEQYFAAVGRGDVEQALSLIAADADFQTPAGRAPMPDGVRAVLNGYVVAFPGNRFEVTRTFGSGDEVAVEGHWVGKHSGPLRLPDGSELPATGKTVRVPYVTLFGLKGNQITSHHAYWDMASFLGQLGLAAR